MKRKSPPFSASLKALAIHTTLVGLSILCLGMPLAAQTRKQAAPPSRQLQQIEAVNTLPGKGKRWALVIGIDNYQDTQITTLGGATNDARAIADALVRYAGFPVDQVILLASDQPTERQPTRGNILRRLSNLRGAVPKDGMLLVAFAGHGIERGEQAFLLTSDAQVGNDVMLLEETAINVTRMKQAIKETGVGQVILILDACRNDPVGRANTDNPLTPAYTRGFNFDVRNREVTAFVTLYATAIGHRAFEFKEKRQGYFTWELVEALSGKAANEKGEVTLARLVSYIQERVPKRVLVDLGKEQRPFAEIVGYKADELVIAVAGQSAPVSLPTATHPTTTIDTAAVAEDGVWEGTKSSNTRTGYEIYLRMYPNGRYVAQAKRKLIELGGESQPNNPLLTPGLPTPASQTLSIQSVTCMCMQYKTLKVASSIMISGYGWDGGSDIKVSVNGRDVSALIDSQTQYVVSVQGSLRELNVRDGRNEVTITVNGVTSNTYVFKQALK
ncbi:MAG TPA: caspase family protein [Pyrinomonadaceae bacterium]|jgi:uncharacterized caspase-like protein